VTEADRLLDTFIYYMRLPSPEEDSLRVEIDAMVPVRVKAGDDLALEAKGFRRGECHRNCIVAAAAGSGEQVFGWTVSHHIYLSHSVMRMADGSLNCITPGHTDELDDDGYFQFCEDSAFSLDGQWMRRSGTFPARSTAIIRRDPDLVRRHYTDLRERVPPENGPGRIRDVGEMGLSSWKQLETFGLRTALTTISPQPPMITARDPVSREMFMFCFAASSHRETPIGTRRDRPDPA
jgi:hypothetical protein